MTECRHGTGRIDGLLRLTIEVGGLDVGRDHPTVVLDRGTGRDRLPTPSSGLIWIAMHNDQVGPRA